MARMAIAVLSLATFAACRKYNDGDLRNRIDGHEQRLAALESAVDELKARLDAGAMIKSVTPIAAAPGGWRIEFTGGSPSSIDIMNGATPSGNPDLITPKIEVRTNANGTISVWYNITAGYPESGWVDTKVDIRGPQGPQGGQGGQGPAGVSPRVRAVDNGNGTITIEYNSTAGYPASGWIAAGDPITIGGNPRDKEAIFSIVEYEATGTITITLNDSDVPADRTVFEFAKASGAVRFELVGFNDRTVIADGVTAQIRFVVNPSDAWVPTGDMTGADAKWALNQTGTRASYVTAPTDFALVGIAKDGEKTGQYVATIKCLAHNPTIRDYAMSLVLNTGTAEKPSLVSSPTFVLGTEAAPLASGQAGDNVWWTLSADGTLTFTGTGDMWDFVSEGSPWYEHRASIETAVIPNGVTSIGDYAFKGCYNLTDVTIPDSVTSIGAAAFSDCSKLTEIVIPDGVETIERSTFYRCYALKEVTIPGSVKTIENDAFRYCWEGLTEVTIPDGVETIGDRAFYVCSKLASVTIPASVTTIGSNAFEGCAITEITIPDGVTTIEPGTFKGCGKLTKVTIGAGVTSIGDKAFSRCALTEITIPAGVKTIGAEAFDYCRSLANVTLGTGVTSIGEKAFNYCDVLTEITLPASVTTIGASAFASTALTEIAIPDGVTTIEPRTFDHCGALTKATIGAGVTSIGDNAFDSCGALTSATIGAGVTSIGDKAFYYCTALADVTCQATTPPTLGISNFGQNTADVLRVPNGSEDAYKGVTAWKNAFTGNIVAIPEP
jgi:hypothetical protein